MPKVGTPRAISSRITGTAYSPVAAGSPGPFERNTPSGLSARMSSAEVLAGTTVTFLPAVAFAPFPRGLVPVEALRAGHHRHEVHPDEAGPFARLLLQGREVELA